MPDDAVQDDRHVEAVQDRPQELEDKLQDVKESPTEKSGGDPVQPTNDRDAQILDPESRG
ncbi:MAG: hypothetical protein KY454_03290 [Actinobacteria bacterium]|nr:hypothetical protein [Actinomycetota bacterium]MBW3649116.1 hypothetical protein [Actinomycetota bacterium]